MHFLPSNHKILERGGGEEKKKCGIGGARGHEWTLLGMSGTRLPFLVHDDDDGGMDDGDDDEGGMVK